MHDRDRLLHVSFNQDGGCFAAGTTSGFRVYKCDSFCEVLRRDLVNFWRSHAGGGGVGTVEMLFRTNILALIGGGGNPKASKVVMWDDHQGRCIGVLEGRSFLSGVRVLRDCVAVVSESSVSVFSFPDLRLQHRYETSPNPRGLCALTPLGARVLACPGPREGQVRVERLHLAVGDRRRAVLIEAHPASAIASLALSQDGRLVATAAVGGASIRMFDAADGKLLQEASLAAASGVHSLAFSDDARFLAASGDGGAVQVFCLQANGQEGGASRFSTGDGERCVVAFGARSNTVMIVSMGGSFCCCRFDPVHGGEMELLERHDFMLSPN